MWFDSLMDDCKDSLELSNKYKGIFVPVFLKLIMIVVLGILSFISIFTSIFSGVTSNRFGASDLEIFLDVIKTLSVFIVIGYIIYVILWALIEVGSINLYRAAINGEKPSKKHFFRGIKTYFKKLSGGKVLIHFLALLLSPIWIIVLGLYIVLIGIPTAGWGILFLTVAISVYFSTWTIAIVNDDLSITRGIKTSFKLARRHFKPLFILVLSLSMIGQYAVGMIGPVGIFIAGWFIGGVVNTFFRVVIYKTYLRYKDEGETYGDAY